MRKIATFNRARECRINPIRCAAVLLPACDSSVHVSGTRNLSVTIARTRTPAPVLHSLQFVLSRQGFQRPRMADQGGHQPPHPTFRSDDVQKESLQVLIWDAVRALCGDMSRFPNGLAPRDPDESRAA